ncbi:hypothetical protein, partial [Burkholderia pseudomallei]|uniref:hypothetical protein n=1 Tax=Burkholderia pseudomallei TaxID=28450 RepID=UPI0035A0BD4B
MVLVSARRARRFAAPGGQQQNAASGRSHRPSTSMQRFVMKKKTLHQMLVKSGVASGLPLLLSLGIVQPALAQA